MDRIYQVWEYFILPNGTEGKEMIFCTISRRDAEIYCMTHLNCRMEIRDYE